MKTIDSISLVSRSITLIISCIFLSACSSHSSTFAYQQHEAEEHPFTELVSKIKNKVNEPQMQWLYFEGKLKAYLNIFVGELKSINEEHKEVRVIIETDKGRLCFTAPLLQGSQRVKIPDEWIPQIINLFELSEKAKITLAEYKTELNLQRFHYMLEKAKKKHSLSQFKSTMLFDL
ncbi:MAG: hypothetical protein K9M07_02400 [Simkaniaceae bacterium]|nr:hypothetical protein [Simkaniaceae bacterium]